jgi:hypothetical protein
MTNPIHLLATPQFDDSISKVFQSVGRKYVQYFNLETAVGRARWCVWAGVCREATRQQAGACNEARQRQARGQTYQRVRSGVTQTVNAIEGKKLSVHATFIKGISGQLRFLGSMTPASAAALCGKGATARRWWTTSNTSLNGRR